MPLFRGKKTTKGQDPVQNEESEVSLYYRGRAEYTELERRLEELHDELYDAEEHAEASKRNANMLADALQAADNKVLQSQEEVATHREDAAGKVLQSHEEAARLREDAARNHEELLSLKSEVQAHSRANSDLEAAQAKLQEAFRVRDKAVEEARQGLEDAKHSRAEASAAESSVLALKSKVSTAEHGAQGSSAAFAAEVAETRRELSQVESRLQAVQKQEEYMFSEVARLGSSQSKAEELRAELDEAWEDAAEERDTLRGRLFEELREPFEDMCEDMKRRIQTLQAERDALRVALTDAEARGATLAANAAGAGVEDAQTQEKLTSLAQKSERLKSELTETKLAAEDARRRTCRIEKERSVLCRELQEACQSEAATAAWTRIGNGVVLSLCEEDLSKRSRLAIQLGSSARRAEHKERPTVTDGAYEKALQEQLREARVQYSQLEQQLSDMEDQSLEQAAASVATHRKLQVQVEELEKQLSNSRLTHPSAGGDSASITSMADGCIDEGVRRLQEELEKQRDVIEGLELEQEGWDSLQGKMKLELEAALQQVSALHLELSEPGCAADARLDKAEAELSEARTECLSLSEKLAAPEEQEKGGPERYSIMTKPSDPFSAQQAAELAAAAEKANNLQNEVTELHTELMDAEQAVDITSSVVDFSEDERLKILDVARAQGHAARLQAKLEEQVRRGETLEAEARPRASVPSVAEVRGSAELWDTVQKLRTELAEETLESQRQHAQSQVDDTIGASPKKSFTQRPSVLSFDPSCADQFVNLDANDLGILEELDQARSELRDERASYAGLQEKADEAEAQARLLGTEMMRNTYEKRPDPSGDVLHEPPPVKKSKDKEEKTNPFEESSSDEESPLQVPEKEPLPLTLDMCTPPKRGGADTPDATPCWPDASPASQNESGEMHRLQEEIKELQRELACSKKQEVHRAPSLTDIECVQEISPFVKHQHSDVAQLRAELACEEEKSNRYFEFAMEAEEQKRLLLEELAEDSDVAEDLMELAQLMGQATTALVGLNKSKDLQSQATSRSRYEAAASLI